MGWSPFTQGTKALKINDTHYDYTQQSDGIPKLDLLRWLPKQEIFPKVYWKKRGCAIEYAALGNILSFTAPPTFEDKGHLSPRFYGGMRFNLGKKDSLWNAFPDCAFWLPAYEVIQTPNSTQLVLHFIQKKTEKARWKERAKPYSPIHLLSKEHSLSLKTWSEHISHVQDRMLKGEIDKVVLARKTALIFSQAPCAWQLMQSIKDAAYNATVFVFQLSEQNAFLGATPEHLYSRKGLHISIDALAATRPRGSTEKEDIHLEKQLRESRKEQKEFLCVKDFIQRTVNPFSTACTWILQDNILKTSHVQHLYNRAEVHLHPGVKESALISALHPTPATAGFPRHQALKNIAQLESFDRGWYASPIGWISPEESDLAVGIRSALLNDRTLHLFAGAGIVSESNAEKEWEELDCKIKLFSSILR
ncbi:MAG TPA: isochorismate synthase [Rhabdochlamydiaceae bacterium]